MATDMEKALNLVENIALNLRKTQVNLKKCSKSRLTQNYIEIRLKCIEDYWSEYKQAYSEIIRNLPKENKDQIPYIAKEEFSEHEELYINLKTELMDLLSSFQINETSLPAPSNSQQIQVVLPKIQLPCYSGQYEEWLSFHDLFQTLVHNNKCLNNVQKLHYLKTSLTGEAASLLKHIQVTDSNYEQAWEILKKRYGNKRITINAVMKTFFSQKKIHNNSSSLIKNLLDTTFECLHHLNNMEVNTKNWDPLIIFVMVQKLDCETHKDWEEYVSNNCSDDILPSITMFRNFLESRFRTLELTEPTKQKSNPVHLREKTFHITTNIETSKKCRMCNENHTLSHCKEFGKYTPLQRSDYIKTNNICFNCLASGHSVRQCRVPTCCKLCRRRHHTLLHENYDTSTNITTGIQEEKQNKQPEVVLHTNVEQSEEEDITLVASHVSTKQSTALLATAIVQVRSEDNYTINLRALIDSGSQASFISERAAQLLKAKRYSVKGTVIGVGSSREEIKQVVQLKIESKCEAFSVDVKTYVMSKQLTTKLPSHTINHNNWPHLKGLVLADPNYNKPSSIDLLLGVDVYTLIVQNELIKGPPGSPCAHKTNLGWILFGKIDDGIQQPESFHVLHHQIISDDFLKTLWEIDHDSKRKYSEEEQKCERFYEDTYKRDADGRYVVRLPFKTDTPVTPNGNTREIAMKRLIQQEKRLNYTPELRKDYDQVLEEYIAMGHMEEVPESEIQNPALYLPHHAVVRQDKETTKVRVVFDASCKGSNGVALNDELMIGPVLQEDMRSIIMRWRMHKICFTSDVVKMYRMVLLDKNDMDYHRLLWRRNIIDSNNSNKTAEVKDYRLKTVTFGTAAAPYLAIKTLMKLAEEEGKQFPHAAKIIREDCYVDDVISGCDTTEEAIAISRQIITILQRGGFHLQKWASNDTNFLKSMDSEKITKGATLDLKIDSTIKALGLSWNFTDELCYQLRLDPISTKITKRAILSDLHKLFDPLGWIAPAIIMAKILVQKLWLEGVGWDEEINTEQLKIEWENIRQDLEKVNDIKIGRWLNTLNNERHRITLHVFCDASERAYAAVIYCRVETKEGDIKTHLIAARTRVAPIKTISLPRLEPCGATLLAKLLHKVSQAMRISPENVFAWTDSTIVLSWLFGEPNRWKPFIANRVVENLEQISTTQWFHVQSLHKPAETASRGLSILELIRLIKDKTMKATSTFKITSRFLDDQDMPKVGGKLRNAISDNQIVIYKESNIQDEVT